MNEGDKLNSVGEVIDLLNHLAQPEITTFKEKKFGIKSKNSLGVFQKEINQVAKIIGKNSELAIALFDTNIYEAKILASKIFNPKELSEPLVMKWSSTFDNWEICDSFSMVVYAKSPIACWVIEEFKNKEPEFEKRTAFATMAGYCNAEKKTLNEVFIAFFQDIIGASDDDRLYVKKAVNWALRSIGKRNKDLNELAQAVSLKLVESEDKSAVWIGKDAFKELSNPGVRISDYPRTIYRP